MSIHVTPMPFHQLSPQDLSTWDALQRSDPALASPYFRPEYVAAVAAVRPRTEVGVIRDGDSAVGFFPYERTLFNIAAPVGVKMTDYQGAILRPGAAISTEDLLRGCHLSGYHFDHLASGQACLAGGVRTESDSPCLDIRGGLDGYLSRIKSSQLDGWLRKRRKLARELGPLRVELQSRSEEVLQTLIAWKTAQYQRTEAPNVFAVQWTRDLVRRCWERGGDDFSGWLSALYAGDKLIAVDLGLRCRNILHGWFPAYDVQYSQYSPGIALNLGIIEAAAAAGVTCIDLGRGTADYKQTLMSSANRVGEGAVSLGWAPRLLHEVWPRLRTRLRTSAMRRPISWLGRATRSWRGYLAFR
ncbi:MAG: GNAT family N-acetyltransferase [Planctomycetaceae bacterium]|nr:GNAT family N-acetyltransferase [Planctomycetaceae bacterium]